MTSILTFAQYDGPAGAAVVTPVIDGRSLVDLVKAAGASAEFDGLAPDFESYGPLPTYFLGQNEVMQWWTWTDRLVLLSCTCGQYGCGNVTARIEVGDQRVLWSDFIVDGVTQPLPDLGPFEFERSQYEAAAALLAG